MERVGAREGRWEGHHFGPGTACARAARGRQLALRGCRQLGTGGRRGRTHSQSGPGRSRGLRYRGCRQVPGHHLASIVTLPLQNGHFSPGHCHSFLPHVGTKAAPGISQRPEPKKWATSPGFSSALLATCFYRTHAPPSGASLREGEQGRANHHLALLPSPPGLLSGDGSAVSSSPQSQLPLGHI